MDQLDAQQRDDRFADELVAELPFLTRLARSLSRDSELAADLAQQAALRAWQARQRYRIGSNIRAWLTVILRNEYASIQRRAWRQVPLDPEWAASLEIPHQQQNAAELADAVRAIHALPSLQQREFVAVVIGGATYRDVAAASHCCEGTTKSRVARARAAIRSSCQAAKPDLICDRPPIGGAVDTLLCDLDAQRNVLAPPDSGRRRRNTNVAVDRP